MAKQELISDITDSYTVQLQKATILADAGNISDSIDLFQKVKGTPQALENVIVMNLKKKKPISE